MLGFNTGSVGVSLLGNFQKQDPPPEALAALAELLAWRMDIGHVDPLSQVGYFSGGTVHTLRAVSGHRDANSTACPGQRLYTHLDAIAGDVSSRGLPKLYEPSVDVAAGGELRLPRPALGNAGLDGHRHGRRRRPVASGSGEACSWNGRGTRRRRPPDATGTRSRQPEPGQPRERS